MRLHGPGGVAGGGRLHAEEVPGQRRDGSGGPAVGQAARRAESDLAVGGGDVLPHGAGVVGVAGIDHVAPHGLQQRLGVGGVIGRQARVHLVAGDVGADDAGVGAAGERLGAVGSGPQVGLERRQERGVIRRGGDAVEDRERVGVLGDGGLVGVAQVVQAGRAVVEVAVDRRLQGGGLAGVGGRVGGVAGRGSEHRAVEQRLVVEQVVLGDLPGLARVVEVPVGVVAAVGDQQPGGVDLAGVPGQLVLDHGQFLGHERGVAGVPVVVR